MVKKSLNPVWGEMFQFEIDRTARFVKIDVYDEDYGQSNIVSDDYLGSVILPILQLQPEIKVDAWLPLGLRDKRDKKWSHLKGHLGEIKVQMYTNLESCHGASTLMKQVHIRGLDR